MTHKDTVYRNAGPKDKAYKIPDGEGRYLYISPGGGKSWRLKYRFMGKEKTLTLGMYPLTSLAEAREATKEAKKLLAAGTDPMEARRASKRAAHRNAATTFESVALEWHKNRKDRWSQSHEENIMSRLKADVFPHIGKRPIADLETPDLLDILHRIENRNAHDIARRVRGICGQIFRYGIATGRCKHDLAANLRDALKSVKTKHYAALDIKEVPAFLQTLEKNEARLYARTRRAIKLLMLTFVRPSELTDAKWDEFDAEKAEWRIPAERMKMRQPHIVPLSRQALALLKEQYEETGKSEASNWVFPNQVRPKDPMSNGTILGALKRLGYKNRQTGHGFRALARTNIREILDYEADVIERQLAHGKKNKVVAAYDRAEFLPKRRQMMQEWADYLDALANENKVIIGKFGKAA